MIQIITFNPDLKGKDVVLNNIHEVQSLDEFDLNIIDMSDSRIWINNNNSTKDCSIILDMYRISKMINTSDRTRIIIILPQNETYIYNYSNGKHNNSCELKDMLGDMKGYILAKLYAPISECEIQYEETTTFLNSHEVQADFYFAYATSLLSSGISNKATVINLSKVIVTTLRIKNYSQVFDLLTQLNLFSKS